MPETPEVPIRTSLPPHPGNHHLEVVAGTSDRQVSLQSVS